MIAHWIILLLRILIVDSAHFNGGTIRWVPVDPNDNSSTVTITIIQTYFWTFPLIQCAANVPISTPGRATALTNLTCVVDCSTDGGYSAQPISILTDCISASSAAESMTSERAVNVTLTAGAHFYLAYIGSAWVPMSDPVISGLQWSIVSMINLIKRPDGLINTPPVASVISPQYVTVNETIQIHILVSDANIGDDVRCRWAVYTPGYRRRRHGPATAPTGAATTISAMTIGSSTIPMSTTIDTPGILQSTSSYPHRQAIDECGGICYPNTVPNGTTLSNCTLSFLGLVPNRWYAVAVQVEDFIDVNSSTPLSSVPVQFLIYVTAQPSCSQAPSIIPLSDCLEASVGIPKTFNISVSNMCNSSISNVSDLIMSSTIDGIQASNLTQSSMFESISYVTYTWTPVAYQIGSQQLCFIAYTSEQVQSNPYCVIFTVISSSTPCVTSTTTTTTTTTGVSTTTSETTKTTTSTTTTVSSTTTTTSASTSTSSTTSTSTTSTSTSTTQTTTTSSSTTTTSTSASTTTTTTSSSTSTTTTTTTSTSNADTPSTGNAAEKRPSWGLIAGISTAVLPLMLCCVCCLYHLLWSPAARHRCRYTEEEEKDIFDSSYFSLQMKRSTQSASFGEDKLPIEVPKKSYQVFEINASEDRISSSSSNVVTNRISTSRINTESDLHSLSNNGHEWIHSSDRSWTNGRASTSVGQGHSILNQLFTNQQHERPSWSSSLKDASPDDFFPTEASQSKNSGWGDFTQWSRLYLLGGKNAKNPSRD